MLDKLNITNYSDRRCRPFKSITRFSSKEVYVLAEELSQYSGNKFTSFSRFNENDFDGYYKKRLRTEEWLFNSFISVGGKPKNAHPLYFVLGESKYLNEWFEDGMKFQLALNKIDPYDISFTFGDSMSIMDQKDRMDLFNKDSLASFVQEKTNDVFIFLNDLNQHNKYIEVQLWNDVYVEDLIKESI